MGRQYPSQPETARDDLKITGASAAYRPAWRPVKIIRFYIFRMAVVFLFCWLVGLSASACADGRPFRLGLNADNWQNQVESENFRAAVQAMGIDFFVWHVSPEEFGTGSILKVIDYCRREGKPYLFNTELVNYVPDVQAFKADGGQTYRWDLQPEILDYLKDDPLFLGVVYDESMLAQNLLGSTIAGRAVGPYYLNTRNLTPEQAFLAVADKISQLADYYQKYDRMLVMETLFPDSVFVEARGGAVLAVKLLKENYNDLMTMTAQSAARQYLAENEKMGRGRELWACIDLWYLDGFPNAADHKLGQPGGHSPAELKTALNYAYTAGYDAAYIEMAKGLMDHKWNLTAHGQAVIDFQREKETLRRSDWRKETEPQAVIRRFPSGHPGGYLPKMLNMGPYGSASYRFQACRPGRGDIHPLCRADLEWWRWFRENSYLKNLTDESFPGTTFNSTPFNAGRDAVDAKNLGRPYRAISGLPITKFLDHTAPPLADACPQKADCRDFYANP